MTRVLLFLGVFVSISVTASDRRHTSHAARAQRPNVAINILEEIEDFSGEGKKATGPVFYNSNLQDLPSKPEENNLARLIIGARNREEAAEYNRLFDQYTVDQAAGLSPKPFRWFQAVFSSYNRNR